VVAGSSATHRRPVSPQGSPRISHTEGHALTAVYVLLGAAWRWQAAVAARFARTSLGAACSWSRCSP